MLSETLSRKDFLLHDSDYTFVAHIMINPNTIEMATGNGNLYFWRTVQQQEIDYVEESGGKITGYEFKWNPRVKSKIPRAFLDAYKAEFKIVSKDNFRDFVGLAAH